MDIAVLDTSFTIIKIVDSFLSCIWTERYSEYGDFELYLSMDAELLNYIKIGNYVTISDSPAVMIIEEIEVESDVENGNKLKASGRSLESILDRRIVWKQTVLQGNFQNGVKKLLNENIISPTDSARKISNFTFQASTDESITSLTVSAQFTGDNLYDVIKALCDSYDLGFRVTLSMSGSSNILRFSLYKGIDRSYGQLTNPYVIFSPTYENLLSTNYLTSSKNQKTVTLVAGAGEGSARETATVFSSNSTGMSRRELYTDARDISKTDGDVTLTDSEYANQLSQRGKEKLSEYKMISSFEGEIDFINSNFQYGVDYNIGDIVAMRNEYGIEAKTRVIEFIRSEDESGYEAYPTFSIVE